MVMPPASIAGSVVAGGGALPRFCGLLGFSVAPTSRRKGRSSFPFGPATAPYERSSTRTRDFSRAPADTRTSIYLAPTVRGRANLDDQVRRDGQQPLGNLAFGKAFVAVVTDVGSANGVRIAARLHERVIAHHMSAIVLERKIGQMTADGRTGLAMP